MSSPLSFRSYGLTAYENTEGLVDRLFPDHLLPFPANALAEAIARDLQLFSIPSGRWKKYPTSPDRAQYTRQLGRFLNRLGRRIVDGCYRSGVVVDHRTWVAEALPQPSPHVDEKLKPELRLVPSYGTSKPTLAMARIAAPVHSSAFNGAASVFQTQDDRRFCLCIQFRGPDVQLLFYSNHRFASSQMFNAHKDPVQLVRILAGLMVGSYELVGQSWTIETIEGQRFLKLGRSTASQYRILKTLYISQNYPARGTRVWHTRGSNGKECIVKDVWEGVSLDTEVAVLSAIRGVPGVPQVQSIEVLETSEDIIFRSPTGDPSQQNASPEVLLLRRIAMVPYAEPLLCYRDDLELVSVLMDTIKAHFHLLSICGILHRNISISSIMMFDPSTHLGSISLQHCVIKQMTLLPLRAGLLTSFSHAIQLPRGQDGVLDRNCLHGEYLYIAIELLLRGPECPHLIGHDLESFFWVLCCICVGHAMLSIPPPTTGPAGSEPQLGLGGTLRSDAILRELDLQPARDGSMQDVDSLEERRRQVGIRKWAMVCNKQAFEITLLAHFLPRFAPLRALASELRDLLFGQSGVAYDFFSTGNTMSDHWGLRALSERYVNHEAIIGICEITAVKLLKAKEDEEYEKRRRFQALQNA